MAVTYGFYDSLNHDRLYNAQQMSAIFDGIINDGVFMSVGNQFHTVAGTGMQVIVKSGRAWFDSTWTLNDAEYPLSIDAADVLLTRIDAVVLEVNSEVATRANTIKVVKGTPASTPVKPTLTNTATIHQHALAYVTVAKNITAITNSMIEIVIGKTETPYVTAILQTTDITDLFKKWENDFQVWFETVKGTLDGDVALNLQNQIDRCVKKADKATSVDIEDGTADKWVDASLFNKERYNIGDIIITYREQNISWISLYNKKTSLSISKYNKLHNIINYMYGPKYESATNTIESSSPTTSSSARDSNGLMSFVYKIVNGHVYTMCILCKSGSNGLYRAVVYEDSTAIDEYVLNDNGVGNHICFGTENGFYYVAAYNQTQIIVLFWDFSTKNFYLSYRGPSNYSKSPYFTMTKFDTCTVIGNVGYIYCHTYSNEYSSTLITLENGNANFSMNSDNVFTSIIKDNNTIYARSGYSQTYYVLDPTAFTFSTRDESTIPKHVKTLLTSDSYNILYTNMDATFYIAAYPSGAIKYIHNADNPDNSIIEYGLNHVKKPIVFDKSILGTSVNNKYDNNYMINEKDILTYVPSLKADNDDTAHSVYEPIPSNMHITLPYAMYLPSRELTITCRGYTFDTSYFMCSHPNDLPNSYLKVGD